MDQAAGLLLECRRLCDEDNEEAAKALLESITSKDLRDASLHLSLAELAERVGMSSRMVLELNLAYRDNPDDAAVLYRLAEVRHDAGQYDKAEKCLREILKKDPLQVEAYRKLGALLEEEQNILSAAMVYREGYTTTHIEEFLKRAAALEKLEPEDEPSRETIEERDQILPSEPDIITYLSLFSGREGVYSRQWVSPTGESGYTPIHEPFTMQVAKNHLIGNHTVGLYQLRVDNTVAFIAFDIDIPKQVVAGAITDKRKWESALSQVHRTASAIVDICSSLEIPAYIEDSGYKGRHVWIFPSEPVPSRVAKNFAALALERVKEIPREVHVEIFPKQTAVRENGLGNLIKIPLGIHKKTGKRSLFLDGSGKPWEKQFSFLKTIQRYSRDALYDLLSQPRQASVRAPVPVEEEGDLPWVEGEEEGKKPQKTHRPILAPPVEYDPERHRELQIILSQCATLRHLVEKVSYDRELNNEEAVVITYTLGHLEKGVEAVNSILGKCANISEAQHMKSRHKGNPMSCPKIRSRIPHITSRVGCNCQFDPRLSVYPNPLLHLQVEHGETLGVTIDSLQFHTILQDYLRTSKVLRETEILFQRYEERMNRLFEEAGIESVDTSFGRLSRVKLDNGAFTFSLDVSPRVTGAPPAGPTPGGETLQGDQPPPADNT